MVKTIRNEKGVTLIEVLLAMAILSIILVSVMNLFPQMGLMNKQNEEKTQGINTAKQLLIEWQNDNEIREYLVYPTGEIPKSGELIENGNEDYYLFKYYYEPRNYNVQVTIYKDFEIDSEKNEARRIYVKLYNERNVKVSETYGYVLSRR
jgi:prepilin-type N-terminal cleavage/methylation domain-containing protein